MNKHYQAAAENLKQCTNPVFVVGSPRSGTGLVARSIAASHDVVYLGETGVFGSVLFSVASFGQLRQMIEFSGWLRGNYGLVIRLVKTRLSGRLGLRGRLEQFVTGALLYSKIENELIPLRPSNPVHTMVDVDLNSEDYLLAGQLTKKYRFLIKRDVRKFLGVAFEDFRIVSGKARILEKTPGHVWFLPLIWRVFPDAQVVFTRRSEKRAVLASYLLMTRCRRKTASVEKDYNRLEAIRKSVAHDYPGKSISVDYEKILDEPLSSIREVYQWLGISEPARLQDDVREIQPTTDKFGLLDERARRFVNRLCGDA